LRKEREMTTRKKTTTGKPKVKKLKLNRETIRDLDVKSKAARVKGGKVNPSLRGIAIPTCHC
jgi:hypothetical protein